jgi:hypothetical protein
MKTGDYHNYYIKSHYSDNSYHRMSGFCTMNFLYLNHEKISQIKPLHQLHTKVRVNLEKVGNAYEIQDNIIEEAFDFYIGNFCDTHGFLSFAL